MLACVSAFLHLACMCVGVQMRGMLMCMCSCARMFVPPPPHGTPLSFCSFGSAGNVTPVPGIAASLDPGNSDDRNRHLLPLQHTHCLATGSPHTFPKPFSKGVFFDPLPLSSFSFFPSFSCLHMHTLPSSSVWSLWKVKAPSKCSSADPAMQSLSRWHNYTPRRILTHWQFSVQPHFNSSLINTL